MHWWWRKFCRCTCKVPHWCSWFAVPSFRGGIPPCGVDAEELLQRVRKEGVRNLLIVQATCGALFLHLLGVDAAVLSLPWTGLRGGGGGGGDVLVDEHEAAKEVFP